MSADRYDVVDAMSKTARDLGWEPLVAWSSIYEITITVRPLEDPDRPTRGAGREQRTSDDAVSET